MRLPVLLFLSIPAIASAFQKPFEIGLGPALESAGLAIALSHADRARQFETAGQWQPALAEYTQVINESQNALRANPGPSQDPSLYYVLGLADTDSARMYHNLRLDLAYNQQVSQYLAYADQALRTAAGMYQQRGIPMWPVTGALASVHILQGNLDAARADLQRIRAGNPGYLPAADAIQQLNFLPPAAPQGADGWSFFEAVFEKVAVNLLPPAYRKLLAIGITATAAGIAAVRQWQQTPRAQ